MTRFRAEPARGVRRIPAYKKTGSPRPAERDD